MSNTRKTRMTRVELDDLADTWARVQAITGLAEAGTADPDEVPTDDDGDG